MRKIIYLIIAMLGTSEIFAQTLSDGVMMAKNDFCTGAIFSHSQWKNYWEGDLKRDNDNLGTVTTQSIMWMGSYGITDKINFIAMIPFVKTKASQGTLSGLEGLQDLTLGAKYKFFHKELGTNAFDALGALAFSIPVSDYTPDFLPLSIGMASKNIAWRLITSYSMENGFSVTASGGYTWRSNVFLDRPSYFTDGQYYGTNEVKMPNVFDGAITVGYRKNSLSAEVSYMNQSTLGGGDIRRQDMPFVSNRMNFNKVGGAVMYGIPTFKNLAVKVSGNFTPSGRNVGQSTTIMAGALYTFHFSNSQKTSEQ